jgi:hypothetical protein
MALATIQPRLIRELPTEDTVPEVSQSLQEGDKASPSLQEEDEVSQVSQSGGDSQSGGASSDHDIAPQLDRPPLTDDEPSSEPVTDIIRRFQEEDEVSRASLSGGDSQSGGASGDHDIAPQPDRPPLTDGEQAGLDQQELPDLGGHLCQEQTPSRDIYQKDLEQIPAREETGPRLTQASRDTSGRFNTRDMANTRTRSKTRLNYTILHRIRRKELAAKAIYLTPASAHAFINALLQHQWIRMIKGLPPEPRRWNDRRLVTGNRLQLRERSNRTHNTLGGLRGVSFIYYQVQH